MQLRRIPAWFSILCSGLLALGLYSGCSDSPSPAGPTGGPAPLEPSSGWSGQSNVTPSGVGVAQGIGGPRYQQLAPEDEDFNCTNVEKTSVRFGHPGYLENARVGMFVEFMGVPVGPVRLLVWWDYDNAPDVVSEIKLEDADVTGTGDLMTIEKIIDHVYEGISRPTERKVRVELIQEGQTGNCARNRKIELTPPPATASAGAGTLACASHPQWTPVTCTTGAWVWASDRTYTTVAGASAAHELYVGDQHTLISNMCSLDGTGWVSTATTVMSGCNTDWYHLTGGGFFNCGGHDGDIVRRLAMGPNDCYSY